MGTLLEFVTPYILEHMIDNVAPTGDLKMILIWGVVMLALTGLICVLNVEANRKAVKVSSQAAQEIRRDLFWHSIHLSGGQMDKFGLPSLISRMTSDSYNLQDFIRSFQTLGIRGPILLFGGLAVSMIMDPGLGTVLCVFWPRSPWWSRFWCLLRASRFTIKSRNVWTISPASCVKISQASAW